MAATSQASTPAPGTGGNIGQAANHIESLLSDDLEIVGTQEGDDNPAATEPKGKRQAPEAPEDDRDPETNEHEGDEGEEADEPEGDEESEGSEEAEEAHELSGETPVTVKIDGKDAQVSLDELRKGYLRQSDYTRKTQALATERNEFQREQTDTRSARERYTAGLDQVGALLAQLTPREPTQAEWDALHAQDPAMWAQQREYWRDWKERMGAVVQERQHLMQQQSHEAQTNLKARFAKEGELLMAAIPEWADPKTAKADKEAIREYATNMGYSPEEVAMTTDHRIFVMARKAMLYDKMIAAKTNLKPGAAPKTTKVVQPGNAASRPTNKTAVTEARARLAKSGKVADAASLLERLI